MISDYIYENKLIHENMVAYFDLYLTNVCTCIISLASFTNPGATFCESVNFGRSKTVQSSNT